MANFRGALTTITTFVSRRRERGRRPQEAMAFGPPTEAGGASGGLAGGEGTRRDIPPGTYVGHDGADHRHASPSYAEGQQQQQQQHGVAFDIRSDPREPESSDRLPSMTSSDPKSSDRMDGIYSQEDNAAGPDFGTGNEEGGAAAAGEGEEDDGGIIRCVLHTLLSLAVFHGLIGS